MAENFFHHGNIVFPTKYDNFPELAELAFFRLSDQLVDADRGCFSVIKAHVVWPLNEIVWFEEPVFGGQDAPGFGIKS